jgi:phosphate uptake regulator
MERKIMALGRSSLVISLPKHWVNLNELKQGDVVSLAIQRDRSLVVNISQKEKERREITLYVDPNDREYLIIRRIIACYLNGYSIIKVTTKDVFSVPHRKAIRNIVRMLYMRIMESDAKSMLIQTLIDEAKAKPDAAIHRMQLIALSMCRDALSALKTRDVKLAKSVFSLDDDVDNFAYFLLRLLRHAARDPIVSNQLEIDPIDCMDHQKVVYSIEHAADNSTSIAQNIIMLDGSKQKIIDQLITLLFDAGTKAVDLYEKAVNAFFSKDVDVSVYILEQQNEIEKLDREIATKTFMSKQTTNALIVCAICSIRDSIKRIGEGAADIAEVAINRAYKMIT